MNNTLFLSFAFSFSVLRFVSHYYYNSTRTPCKYDTPPIFLREPCRASVNPAQKIAHFQSAKNDMDEIEKMRTAEREMRNKIL